jgi:hypothetical protein
VSLTPAANLSPILGPLANFPPVSTTPAVWVAKFATGAVYSSGKFDTGVVNTAGKFATGVVDTGGAPGLATQFLKKFEMTLKLFARGLGEDDSW